MRTFRLSFQRLLGLLVTPAESPRHAVVTILYEFASEASSNQGKRLITILPQTFDVVTQLLQSQPCSGAR